MNTTIPAKPLGVGDPEMLRRFRELATQAPTRDEPDLIEAIDAVIERAQPMTRLLPTPGTFFLISGDLFDALIAARDGWLGREQEAAEYEDRVRG